jgi:hypothetical protein
VHHAATNCDTDAGPFLVDRDFWPTTLIDLRAGLDEIRRRMSPKGCRYEIRRAEKMRDRMEVRRNTAECIADFLSVYNSFAGRKSAVSRVYSWSLTKLAPVSDVFVVYLDGRAMCGHVMLCDNKARRVRLMFSGSRRLENARDASLCAALNRYLHWHEIQTYYEQGMRCYDLGGIRYQNGNDEFSHASRFKLSFGGSIVPEYSYVFSGAPAIGRLVYGVYRKMRGRVFKPAFI